MNAYTGKRIIHELHLLACELTKLNISMRTLAKNQLQRLHISQLHLDEIPEDFFVQQSNIKWISFEEVSAGAWHKKFLFPTVQTLERVSIEWLPNDYNIDDIFNYNADMMWKIEILEIQSWTRPPQRLAASNFSHLPELKYLYLSHCGIDSIDANAFDFIEKGLILIYLRDNRIKYINPYMIHRLLESKSKRMAISINLANNLIDCNCELLELMAISNVVFGTFNDPNDEMIRVTCANQWQAKALYRSNCNGVSVFQLRCNHNLRSDDFLYPGFGLKINDNSNELMIKTTKQRVFRLWIHNLLDLDEVNRNWQFANRKCPIALYLQKHINCFLFRSARERLSIAAIARQMGNVQICVNYISMGPKTMWPLNCITHNWRPKTNQEHPLFPFVIIVCAVLAGIFFSLIIFKPLYNVCSKRWMKSRGRGILRSQSSNARCLRAGNDCVSKKDKAKSRRGSIGKMGRDNIYN